MSRRPPSPRIKFKFTHGPNLDPTLQLVLLNLSDNVSPCLQVKQETLPELRKKYKKVSADEAEPHWNEQFKTSAKRCSHAYW